MMLPRLVTRVWVSALVRRCNVQGVAATVIRHGYDEAGAVLLLARRRDGLCQLFGATQQGIGQQGIGQQDGGQRAWLPLTGRDPVSEADADAIVEKQRRFDPDLWVVEIETDRPQDFLDEVVLAQ